MSRIPIEQPVTSKNTRGGTTTTHPAYGQIVAHRTQGGPTYLYGSDFGHHATMRITIRRSELNRDLHRDWHFPRDELIEIELSEAQWATFVSAPNVGSGPPCTILHVNGERMPELPPPQARHDQFSDELKAKLKGDIEALKQQYQEIVSLGLPKAKTEKLRDALAKAIQNLEANLPFTVESFDNHMETSVEKAKQEVHGYMTGVIQRAGLDALAAPAPLQLTGQVEKDDAA